MRKTILIIAVLLNFLPCTTFAVEYSLDDLYGLALERSETVKIAGEDTYISMREKDRAMAVLIPKLSAFGSHTKYSDQKKSNSSVIQPENSTSWGLKMDQSLSVSGRELTALKIAKTSIVKSRFDYDSVKEGYLLNVASDYYGLLKAKKALEIANANVERLTKHRDAAQTRLRVGEITKTVLLRAEAELSGAQSDLIRAENNLKLAKVVLARTAGISGDYEIKESEVKENNLPFDKEGLGGFPADCGLSSVDCLKQAALSERNELKSADLDRNIAEDQIRYTRGLYWPDFSVEGVYSRREDSPSSFFANKESIYGVLRLDYPFFEGGLRKAEVRQSEARFRQADYRLEDLKKTINVEVEDSYLNLITVSGVLEKLKAEVEYARDNYNAVSKQFQYGLADSIDIIDANTLLVTSEREFANAQYDYQFAALQLRRATGTLLETVVGR
ncbi:MAG: TolC family protein [Nitrospiraceae bacterium]|nr:MAG: TolC family protein [Nitrospiraceae bacterium]